MRPNFASKKIRGLGDVVYYAAKPIAMASDAVLKTNFQQCPRCKRQREHLNQQVPFTP